MRKTSLTLALLLLTITQVLAAPDPRDSVIVEHKVTAPFTSPCGSSGLKIRVWITNKDTLKTVKLPMETVSLSGGAYGNLSRPSGCAASRTFSDVFDVLLPANQLPGRVADFSGYNGVSPDHFHATLSSNSNFSFTPPHLSRTPFMDIKFDAASGDGQFQLDSIFLTLDDQIQFVNLNGLSAKPNCSKGIVSVTSGGGGGINPKDSLIIESKTVTPGSGPGYLRVRFFFSNKDTLANISMPLEEKSLSGGAYAILAYGPNNPFAGGAGPYREDDGTGSFDLLLPSPQLSTVICNYPGYNSSSTDTFLWTATASPPTGARLVLPGSRRPLLDVKFDSVFANFGQFHLDTGKVLAKHKIEFVTKIGATVRPNFVKGIITVANPVKGDLNLDGVLNSVDVVLMLSCVFLGIPPPTGVGACDVNCSGGASPLDVVYQMNVVFGYWSYPCP